jgi:branched-chain amino acid transport system permease protein
MSSAAPRIARLLLPALAVLALALLGTSAGGYETYVISLAVIGAVVGVALVLLVGYARVVMLATGAMMALGAYGTTILVLHTGLPFGVALVMGVALGAAGGALLGLPGSRVRSHNLALVTLAFQAVVTIGLREATALTGGSAGLRVPRSSMSLLGLSLGTDAEALIAIGLVAALAVLVLTVLVSGSFGKGLRAIAATETGAEAYGIHVAGYGIMAFALSSAVLALAGALLAPLVRILTPDSFGVLYSVIALAYPVVGGMFSVWGGLLGGGLLRVLPEILRPVAEYQELLYAALVLAVLVFLPGGLVEAISRLAGGLWRTRPARPPVSKAKAAAESSAAEGIRLAPRPGPPIHTSASQPPQVALAVEGVTRRFGGLTAVRDVHLAVRAGTVHGLIGPNGAGKTTLFNIVSGFLAPDAGSVRLFGEPLAPGARDRVSRGVTRTFQNVALYGPLSCLDNVVLGIGANGLFGSLARSFDEAFGGPGAQARRQAALEALAAVGLAGAADRPAQSLPLGDQRRLEIARAIVSRPRLLLLDEPVSGLDLDEEGRMRELLRALNEDSSVTMVVVSHNIRFVLELCGTLSVMAAGQVIAEGDPREVIAHPAVRDHYFARTPSVA